MAWNNGLERKRFESEQAKLAAEYRAAGMSEEQIQQAQLLLVTLLEGLQAIQREYPRNLRIIFKERR